MIRATQSVLLRKELKRINLNIYFILIITFLITDINCLIIIGLFAKLYRTVISKLPSYWVASNKLFDCKIRTLSLGIRFEAETHVCFFINSVISVYISTKSEYDYHPSNCISFLSGLSFTTIHESQDWIEGGWHFFDSWQPLPPASQTLRH